MKTKIEPGDLVEFNWRENAALGTRVTGIVINEREAEICNHPRAACRLLVKRARRVEQWPTNREFQAFASAIADSVQRALFDGKRLGRNGGPSSDDYCPLGTLPQAENPWPASNEFAASAPGTEDQRVLFACGYDDDWIEPEDEGDPYYLLGLEYRARFVRKGPP
jgi:hypothetical protein